MRAALLPKFGVKNKSWPIFPKEMFHLTTLYICGEHTASSALLGSPKPHRKSPWPDMGLWESSVGCCVKPLSAFRPSWTSSAEPGEVGTTSALPHVDLATTVPKCPNKKFSPWRYSLHSKNIPKMGRERLGDAIEKPLHISGQFEHCAFNHLAEAGDREAKDSSCPCRHNAFVMDPGLLDQSL